ncbi:aminopeptidase [Candidatus Woesearchaeota archaeon]|nr:aminopeptidase [Candidatus Woesearchaeota archaeon]RLE40228.1 MAG: aminopeptidase [Candidatus Woesearchaeota archaeon]
MVDPRIKKLASILTSYSIKIKKGDIINLNFGIQAKELALECFKQILKKGATAITHASVPGFTYTYYKLATKKQLEKKPIIALYEAQKVAGSISIIADINTRELTNIPNWKIALRNKVTYPVHKIHLKKDNWVLTIFPTPALAQEADMSYEEYYDFIFKATNIDWRRMSKKQDKLKAVLDKGKEVRIVAEGTDIRFSIKGREAIKCDGHRNMPDGEVFIAPVETTTEGKIRFTYPAIRQGRIVEGVELHFKKGRVIKASAEKGEAYLKEMLSVDSGAKRLGEFGIGMNYNINRFTKEILLDEKIGGTIHLALGMAYKEGGGRNESAIHWDMILDLRKGGAIYIDGKCIQRNGKFLI